MAVPRAPGYGDRVEIRIEGTDLPGSSCGPSPDNPGGHHNIHVAVQHRGKPAELLGLTPADAPAAVWTLDCELTTTPSDSADLRGPYIQGPPGARFIYLSWGTVDSAGAFRMFRRAKLMLAAVPSAVLDEAASTGTLVGRLGLTDAGGGPVCAAVRPSAIVWSAR
jgi:hypothetical protein